MVSAGMQLRRKRYSLAILVQAILLASRRLQPPRKATATPGTGAQGNKSHRFPQAILQAVCLGIAQQGAQTWLFCDTSTIDPSSNAVRAHTRLTLRDTSAILQLVRASVPQYAAKAKFLAFAESRSTLRVASTLSRSQPTSQLSLHYRAQASQAAKLGKTSLLFHRTDGGF